MRERILAFVQGLRGRGVAVSVAEAMDALYGVAAVGVEREDLRETLAAALVKDERVRSVFDGWFDEAFPLVAGAAQAGRRKRRRPAAGGSEDGLPRGRGGGAGGGRGPTTPEPERSRGRTALPEPRPAAEELRARDGSRRREAPAARRAELLARSFAELTARDVEESRTLVEALARALRARLARRTRPARRGRIDVRRTLRAAASTGGVPLHLERRVQRRRRPDLVALCDLSGSVAAASELCLGLLAPAGDWFARVDLFAYVDRLVGVSIERGHVAPAGPIDLHAGSDFGRVLADLWHAHEARLGRSTAVVILGDARNNRLPPRVDLLRRVRDRVQRIVWLVPEPRPRWDTGDSVLALYAPFCDAVIECTNLQALDRAVRRLFV